MSYAYYNLVATYKGEQEVLFGSYNRSDCDSELEAEKESWKADGYSKFKTLTECTDEAPDPKVYPELS